jgi:hypothetical protein
VVAHPQLQSLMFGHAKQPKQPVRSGEIIVGIDSHQRYQKVVEVIFEKVGSSENLSCRS